MLMIFVLGFFIEWIEISYIAVPLSCLCSSAQNVDLVWLAMLICVNLQTSFLTPPFGWALFFLRGVAPPEMHHAPHVHRRDSLHLRCRSWWWRSSSFYPQLALWLPKTIGW